MINAGIIVFPGTTCERDTARACEFFGWEVNFIRHDEVVGTGYDIIFLPGGFSYGDNISAGRIAKSDTVVKSLPVGKTLIVGICNGFQILCEAGLLPGTLNCNDSGHFISKVVPLEFQGETINLPIAHGQGKYVGSGHAFMYYKDNVNGSEIAGVIEDKIIGLMPHPERAVHSELGLTDGRRMFEFFRASI
jgi:phosphoribosylformylglycinamidine synthase